MRLRVLAIGRMKDGAERDLCDRYMDRAARAGKALGFSKVDLREWPESRQARAEERRAEEAAAMLADLAAGTFLIALDETGRALDSVAFATLVGQRKDAGVPALALAIGGPDGHGEAVRARADLVLALGPMTWPHQLVRVMLAEQLYRAVTILSGHPYHRA